MISRGPSQTNGPKMVLKWSCESIFKVSIYCFLNMVFMSGFMGVVYRIQIFHSAFLATRTFH